MSSSLHQSLFPHSQKHEPDSGFYFANSVIVIVPSRAGMCHSLSLCIQYKLLIKPPSLELRPSLPQTHGPLGRDLPANKSSLFFPFSQAVGPQYHQEYQGHYG